MMSTTNDHAAQPRQRFSDRIEFRRGKRDAQTGRAPASFARQYVAGYAEGKREAQAGGQAKITPTDSDPGGALPFRRQGRGHAR